jgi:putative glutamine amidotransferase
MTRPIIGITTYAQDEDLEFKLPRQYVDCVRRAGGLPWLLPPGEMHLNDFFAAINGLILTGGGDLDPECYHGKPHSTLYMVDSERDTMELQIARTAIATGMPTLAICRGVQVINVALGGTLFEHLLDVVGNEVTHRLPPREPAEHPIRVLSDSHLAKILTATEFSAASWHHQAIRDVGSGLEPVAHAADDTIEAVEMCGHPWLIGVQWHPELTAATDAIQQRLFDEFVTACKDLRGNL